MAVKLNQKTLELFFSFCSVCVYVCRFKSPIATTNQQYRIIKTTTITWITGKLSFSRHWVRKKNNNDKSNIKSNIKSNFQVIILFYHWMLKTKKCEINSSSKQFNIPQFMYLTTKIKKQQHVVVTPFNNDTLTAIK